MELSANLVIWIFGIILALFTFVQAGLFVRNALDFNKKHNILSKEELKGCVKTGFIACIGPGVNSVFMAVSMMALVGSGLTFMREAVIGAPAFEVTIINYAASLINHDLTAGYAGLSNSVLTFFVFAGAVGSSFTMAGPLFMIRPLEMGGGKNSKNDGQPNLLMRVLPNVSVTIMTVFLLDYMTSGLARAVGYVVGALVTLFMYYLIGKGKKSLNSWVLIAATAAGITCAQIVALMVG